MMRKQKSFCIYASANPFACSLGREEEEVPRPETGGCLRPIVYKPNYRPSNGPLKAGSSLFNRKLTKNVEEVFAPMV
jgi:hypothetical protein